MQRLQPLQQLKGKQVLKVKQVLLKGKQVLKVKQVLKLADGVVEAIAKAARTDKIGDGKVFVLDVERALRIRTGETDVSAL